MIFKAIAPNGQIVEDKKYGKERKYTHMVLWFSEKTQMWYPALLTTEEKKANKKAKDLLKFSEPNEVAVASIIK